MAFGSQEIGDVRLGLVILVEDWLIGLGIDLGLPEARKRDSLPDGSSEIEHLLGFGDECVL